MEDALSENEDNGPFLFGEKFTIADVGWVPILDRMDATRWWSIVDRNKFPRGKLKIIYMLFAINYLTSEIFHRHLSKFQIITVWKYWEAIQLRPSFKLAQGTTEYTDHEVKIERCKKLIDHWKSKYAWFNAIYQG